MYWRDIENLEERQKSHVAHKHRIEREIKELIYEKKDTKENRKCLKRLKSELENWV